MKSRTAARMAGFVLNFVSGWILAEIYKQHGMAVALSAGGAVVLTFFGSLLTRD